MSDYRNRLFHGGCHGCAIQEEKGVVACNLCQYKTHDWSMPNLFKAQHENLIRIVEDSKQRHNESHGEVFFDNATKSYHNKYGHHSSKYEFKWNPAKCSSTIKKQFEAGYTIPIEFLEKYGKYFQEELKSHPEYSETIIPLLIEYNLDELIPDEMRDVFFM